MVWTPEVPSKLYPYIFACFRQQHLVYHLSKQSLPFENGPKEEAMLAWSHLDRILSTQSVVSMRGCKLVLRRGTIRERPKHRVQARVLWPKSTAPLKAAFVSPQSTFHFSLGHSGQFHCSVDFPCAASILPQAQASAQSISNTVVFLPTNAAQKYLKVNSLRGSLNIYRTGAGGQMREPPIVSCT